MNHKKETYDIICVGELLVDCLSDELIHDIKEIKSYKRFIGGSPALFSLNLNKLGNKVQLIATIGDDDNGDFIIQSLENSEINCQFIKRSRWPSSIKLSFLSKDFNHFKYYRGADIQISEEQLDAALLDSGKVLHTSCFALSKIPAQYHILEIAQKAHSLSCQLSLHINYSEMIWHDKAAAKKIVADYCALDAFVILSDADWLELYEDAKKPEEVIQYFLDLGAKEVCLFVGNKKCIVANQNEKHEFEFANRAIINDEQVFWAAYMTASLDDKTLEGKAKAGCKMLELQNDNGDFIANSISKEDIYQ